MGQFKKIIKIL